MKLFNLRELIETEMQQMGTYRSGETNYYDNMILNNFKLQVQKTTACNEDLAFHTMMAHAFHNHTSLFQFYRELTLDDSIGGMHQEVVKTYLHTQVMMLAPITPHLAEDLWKTLGNTGSIFVEGRWDSMKQDHDEKTQAILDHCNKVISDLRLKYIAKTDPKKSKAKKGQAPQPVKKPTGCVIYVAKEYRADSKKLLVCNILYIVCLWKIMSKNIQKKKIKKIKKIKTPQRTISTMNKYVCMHHL